MGLKLAPSPLQFIRGTTLGEMLIERAEGPQGEDIRFLHVADEDVPPGKDVVGSDRSVAFSYAEVGTIARRSASLLRRRGVSSGDRVLLILPTGPSYLAAFYGCQILGAIPVPVVPPYSIARLEEHLERIARIAGVSQAKAAVVHSQLTAVLSVARRKHRQARFALSNLILGSDLLCEETAELELQPAADAGFIQFTSGSTGDPKGVVLPHASLLANMKGIGTGAHFQEGDLCCGWLPLFHDMGLIGLFLTSMAWGMPLVLMPPEKFIRRPKEWLRAMSRYGGTCSAAPNFAYSLCTRKVRGQDLADTDLSAWRVAFCGAEPINPETVASFIAKFTPHGFRASTFYPVYGMAEFSLAATLPVPGRPPRLDRVDRRRFEQDGVAQPAEEGEETANAMIWVSVGKALPGNHQVRIVDDTGATTAPRHEGEIEIRGSSLMAGYYQAPLATADVLRDGWLRTGDRGYLDQDGELYVTGRTKELIIKGGKNLFPQDVETASAKVPGVRMGCCAAFGLSNEQRGTEDLILICETRVTDADQRAEMIAAIRQSVLNAIGATPDAIVLVPPGTVPKTSSGKIQRNLMKTRYRQGNLSPSQPTLYTLVRLKWAQWAERARSLQLLRWKNP